jgi:hypothetical protein
MPETLPLENLKTPQEMLEDVHILDHAAGAWSRQIIGGQPVTFFVTRLFQRIGVPEGHSLWNNVEWVHPSHAGETVRLPQDFPPDNWQDYVPKLETARDWLELVRKVDLARREKSTEPAVVAPQAVVDTPTNSLAGPNLKVVKSALSDAVKAGNDVLQGDSVPAAEPDTPPS